MHTVYTTELSQPTVTLPLRDLGEEIALLAAQLDAGTHRLLTCIRELDVTEGWHRQGAQSCAHWLTWRIGLDFATAREKVRVARALGLLPALDAALAAGRLSYAKVRAITRVATAETEERLLEMALVTTGAQMERICRRFRGVRDQHLREEGDGQDMGNGLDGTEEGRGVHVRQLANGMVRLEITLEADEADLVVKAIEKARDELRATAHRRVDRPGGAVSAETPTAGQGGRNADEPEQGTVASRGRFPLPARADGLLSMAETSLRMPPVTEPTAMAELQPDHGLGVQPPMGLSRWSSDRYRVLIHLSDSLVGPEGGHEAYLQAYLQAYLEDGTPLSPEAFRRISCDGGLVPAVVQGELSRAPGVLDVGRQSRAIPAALRRALWLRDGGCCFPGCANHRFVHGHHVRHWAHGGSTALHNLILLCTFHHRLVHEGGFRVQQDAISGVREWRDPHGRCIPEVSPPAFADDERPNLLALGDLGVALPSDSETNACGWDGWPVDHVAVLDALIGADPLFASG